jgi:hypothetical protein
MKALPKAYVRDHISSHECPPFQDICAILCARSILSDLLNRQFRFPPDLLFPVSFQTCVAEGSSEEFPPDSMSMWVSHGKEAGGFGSRRYKQIVKRALQEPRSDLVDLCHASHVCDCDFCGRDAYHAAILPMQIVDVEHPAAG